MMLSPSAYAADPGGCCIGNRSTQRDAVVLLAAAAVEAAADSDQHYAICAQGSIDHNSDLVATGSQRTSS